MDLSSDQLLAISTILDWYKSSNRKPYITLGGYAGTGKTTVIARLRDKLRVDLRVAYCAYTGKATSVLRNKLLKSKSLYKNDSIGTIHSLIYKPVLEGDEIIGWTKEPILEKDLIIVDESSMVSKDIFDDLLSYGIPIICIGDHGQLPPISDDDFNLMNNPEIKLETVHRFDNSEESPLLKLSMMARIDGYIPYGVYGDGVLKVDTKSNKITPFVKLMGNFENSFCVVGFNDTRIKMNKKFRTWLKRPEHPIINDRIICLRNNKNSVDLPIYNGMIGTITEKFSHDKCYDISCRFDGENNLYTGYISKLNFNAEKSPGPEFIYKNDIIKWKKQRSVGDFYSVNNNIVRKKEKIFLDNFDYAYAITCHKSQGSEMENVMVIEQKCSYWSNGDMWRRWLYTAVTRSRKNLLIVSNEG
jgi:ATP-dependent exoDNAse (exonuclease V) alpha subunit